MSPYHNLSYELSKTGTTLVAVSKNRGIAEIMNLYEQGQRIFGENRVQELLEKKDQLPGDIEWHLIGHLQRNKVKQIAPFISLIHSVDSLRLLLEINEEAKSCERVIPVLLQVHIAQEESKFGLDKLELINIMEYYLADAQPLRHIEIRGLMGMATNTSDMEQVHKEFSELRSLSGFLKDSYLPHKTNFTVLSMGMSSDYETAIRAGSNMVRIGSLLFE